MLLERTSKILFKQIYFLILNIIKCTYFLNFLKECNSSGDILMYKIYKYLKKISYLHFNY